MAVRNLANMFVPMKVQYYLLRAYDLGAPTPTPVFWTATEVSYLLAPPLVFGGPYGPIDIVRTWRN